MRDRFHICRLTTTALTLAAASAALAQTITGSVNGNVTDQAGAIVPNATVVATNVETGVQSRTVTNGSGDYNLRFLQIGQYTVTIMQKGFATQKFGPITLEVDQAAKIDAKLAVGSEATTVSVTSELQPLLDTDNSTISSSFSANAIDALPLNGRNFSSVTVFVPGAVSTQPTGLTGTNGIERDTLQEGQVSINGNRNQTNNYLLDGIDINETLNNLIGYNPSPDALENLTVITSNADAEYGNVNGGDVIAVLKSGTNHFHGSAFGFLENDNLDANTWANKHQGAIVNPTTGALTPNPTPRSDYTQTIFGGTIGGPILHNKLFFFADYEGARFHTGGTGTDSVIPLAFRKGDFSSLLTLATPIQLYHYVAGQGSVPYANNQVPVTSTAAQYLFAHPSLYPAPNAAGSGTYGIIGNLKGPTSMFVRNDQGDVKIDYTLGQHDTIMGRYSQGDAMDGQPVTPLDITFPTGNAYPFKGLAFNWVHTFSPSIVNEARAGWSRIRWIQGTPVDLTGQLGLNGNSLLGINAPQPYVGFAALQFNGNSDLNTVGTTGGATNFIDNNFQYDDNLTIQQGKQTFKMGVEILRYQQNNFYPGDDGAMGTFGYNGDFTGLNGSGGFDVADFETNQAYTAQVGAIVGRTGQRQYRDAGFFQDDWKAMPNLTLNLGLRYEYDQPIYEVNNKEANVDLATGVAYTAGEAGTSNIFGDNRALYHPVYNNFMPRIGFSYQPMQRVVVRGGYGITNYLEGTGSNLRLTFNPPFQGSYQAQALLPTATSPGTPLSIANGFVANPTQLNASNGTYRAWDSNLRPAFIQEYTLSTEYQLNNASSVVLAYLGQSGQRLIDARAANQLTAPGATAPYATLVGQGGAVVETQSDGTMHYDAAQVQFRHRQSSGIEYQVNYTFSHALTNSSGFYGVNGVNGASPYWQDAYNGHADYGNSGFDTRHNLSANGQYQLPFGRGKRFGGNMNRVLDEAAGGWKVDGTAIAYSGLPVTLTAPDAIAVNNRASRANFYRPIHHVHRSINNWFGTDPSATPCVATAANPTGADNGTCGYGVALPGTFGTAENNTERAPGYEQIDLSAAKAFAITETQHLEFRGDFFNAFNIASYSNPDNGVTDGNFGQITGVRSPPRQIQFSLKYAF